MIRFAFAALTLSAAGASALELDIPVRCELGRDCYIQSFADRMPGPEAADYTCGTLSYDGHGGTDFRVPTLRDMAQGVDVLAAAPGRVRGVRDGEPDTGLAGATDGRECGNGVAIEHGDGWETQYCHLAEGSIAVRAGEFVKAGQALGQIGLSGNTEFPHLHLSVRRNGDEVDPFDARPLKADCALDDTEPLWSDAAQAMLEYQPGGIVDGGFTNGPADLEAIRAGAVQFEATDPPAIVFWTRFYGVSTGDRLTITILRPSTEILAQTEAEMPRPRAEHMIFTGRKRPTEGWEPGTYRATARLIRSEGMIETYTAEFTLP